MATMRPDGRCASSEKCNRRRLMFAEPDLETVAHAAVRLSHVSLEDTYTIRVSDEQ